MSAADQAFDGGRAPLVTDTGQVAQISSDLKTVLSVSRAMSLERDLAELLDIIVEAAGELVNADRCSLFIVDRGRDEIWTTVAQGSGEIRLPLGSGIAGAVAKTGQVINIPDAYRDTRFNPAHDRETGYRTTSILCMPLIDHEDRIVGALQTLNKRIDRRRLRNSSERARFTRARRNFEHMLQNSAPARDLVRCRITYAVAAMDYGDDATVEQLLADLEAEAHLERREAASVKTLRARFDHTREEFDHYATVPFSRYDEEVLAALCSQAAVAIDNTQLIAHDMERQQLMRDMQLARDIQAGLLPDGPPPLAGWRCAAWYDACDETSGDYYDYLVPRGLADHCDMVVGDVTGHGIGAALMMSSARAFLLGLYRQTDDLAVILRELNALLEHDMADDVFMTMCIARLHPDGCLDYAAAGHEAPLVYRAGEDRFEELPEGGLMLGVLDESDYQSTAVPPLAAGDLLLLFTDGIFEAIGPASDEAFGLERVQVVVRDHAADGAQAVIDALRSALRNHLGGRPAQDDITLVIAERLA